MTAPRLTRRGRAVRFVAIVAGSSACFTAGLTLPGAASNPYTCPSGAHLTSFEDGSGACYPDHPSRGELDQYPWQDERGREITWPAGTFGWDCRTDGNGVCGADVDVQACWPVGSAAAAKDGCPSRGDQ